MYYAYTILLNLVVHDNTIFVLFQTQYEDYIERMYPQWQQRVLMEEQVEVRFNAANSNH